MKILYTLLYVLFFLIDDLVIFIIAMVTMEITGISTKYNKYSHLLGGIIMLVMGLLLIFKPEWLMFQFKQFTYLEILDIIYFRIEGVLLWIWS